MLVSLWMHTIRIHHQSSGDSRDAPLDIILTLPYYTTVLIDIIYIGDSAWVYGHIVAHTMHMYSIYYVHVSIHPLHYHPFS